MAEFVEGVTKIQLSEEALANIGRAALYEGSAKTALSISLKALRKLNYEQWISIDKKQFKWLVDEINVELVNFPNLKPHFEAILKNYERWRDKRNLIIHAPWGENQLGKPVAYCYRRGILADENDITSAVNDCFWLAKEVRSFAYQIALLIECGEIKESVEVGPGISMFASSRSVRF